MHPVKLDEAWAAAQRLGVEMARLSLVATLVSKPAPAAKPN